VFGNIIFRQYPLRFDFGRGSRTVKYFRLH
jgi:hypothetical protein